MVQWRLMCLLCMLVLQACTEVRSDCPAGEVPMGNFCTREGSTTTPDASTTDTPTAVCPAGQTLCGFGCANLQTDGANCGACRVGCATGQVCSSGACVPQGMSCSAPMQMCGGICTDVSSNRSNCGACGNACPVGQSCSGGACSLVCSTGLTNCGGRCLNVTGNDASNCGACGSACAPGQTCASGICRAGATCTLGEASVCVAGASAPGCCADGRRCAAYVSGGPTHCCRDEGGACTLADGTGCCGSLVCASGVCSRCRAVHETCSSNGQCCSGACANNPGYGPGPTCVTTCRSGADCPSGCCLPNQGTMAMACADREFCDSRSTCIVSGGVGTCSTDSQCCLFTDLNQPRASICNDGTCTRLCSRSGQCTSNCCALNTRISRWTCVTGSAGCAPP
jgi:hypothetical protein